ncbi:MAG: hypothetical protein IK997_02985 [Bacilli bacterium]|nr:hypothetical protein [Bacilli bacterium]
MRRFNNYENYFIYNFIFILVVLIIMINVLNEQIPIFKVVQGELIENNAYSIFVNNKSLKRLEKNPYIYINNKKVKIEIVDIYKNYYKNYNKLIIKCRKKQKAKELKISIYDGKKSFFKIFLECWEE